MLTQEQYTELVKRKYTAAQRRQLASEGKALPDGSFPIVDEEDLGNAIDAVGLGQSYSRARQHIIRRARAIGKTLMLPGKWMAKSDAVLSGLSDEALLRAHLELHRQGAHQLLKSGSGFTPGLVHRHAWFAREMEARGLDHQILTVLDKAGMTTSQLGTMGGGTGVTAPQMGPGGKYPGRNRRRRRRGAQNRYPDFEQMPATLDKADGMPTMDKQEVDYRDADPGSDESCGTCAMFKDTGSGTGTCSLVKGAIASDDVCNMYEPSDSTDNALEGPDNEGAVGVAGLDDQSKRMVKVELPLRELVVLEKANRGKQRFTLSVAYPADDDGQDPDSQGEFAPAAVVEEAAWWFMQKGRQSGVMHIRGAEGEDYGQVVESYIYRNDQPWVIEDVGGKTQTVKKGDWLVGQVWQPRYHALIEKGRFTGVSIQGQALAEDIPDPLTDWMRF